MLLAMTEKEGCLAMTKEEDTSDWYDIVDILSSLRTSWQIHRPWLATVIALTT